MPGRFISRYLAVGEVSTATGRALVEERYLALRRQIPIIYAIAVVNLAGVELATSGQLSLGFNIPTIVAAVALVRMIFWIRAPAKVAPSLMLRRMRQTCWLAAALCLAVGWWCLQLTFALPDAAMAVMLFGSLTALGVSYGLSPLPVAAMVPLLVLALPLAVTGFLSDNLRDVGGSLSICFVSLLMLRMVGVNNAHFTALIQSRSVIARQRQAAEAARREAHAAATTDFLCGLPNRRAFVTALETEIASKPQGGFAVGILDLDRFKVINDTFGHSTGDRLLMIVGERLLKAAGNKATVARLGGDEFGLLFHETGQAEAFEALLDSIVAQVNRPAIVDGRPFAVSVCCGIAVSADGRQLTPSRLLADADLALYEAKDQSGGSVALFEPWMEVPRRRRAQIERALQLSNVHDHVDLVFQPIVDLSSGRIIAVEALARWTDEELGEVSPSEFIPVAEQLDVIGNLSTHLMKKALAEAANWPDSVRLSFNLSAVQLSTPDCAAEVLSALRSAALAPPRLQVEVTETALLRDFERAKSNLAKLREAGVNVVLDDFGAGYASISYLKRFSFDQIKIDGDLLASSINNERGELLLAAVIGLIHALGVEAVAEHVETEGQLKALVRLGCFAGQGFLISQPLTAPDCAAFLECMDSPSARSVELARKPAA